jgi:hypothetical protein
LFAVAQLRPLTPQQYAMTLRMGSASPEQFPADLPAADLEKRLEGLEGAARGMAGLFEQPGADFQVSIDEALLMTNGERIEKELLRDSRDALVGRLKELNDPAAAIELAGWTILSRPLVVEEQQLLLEYLRKRSDRPVDGYRQMVWAMLASGECRFNH